MKLHKIEGQQLVQLHSESEVSTAEGGLMPYEKWKKHMRSATILLLAFFTGCQQTVSGTGYNDQASGGDSSLGGDSGETGSGGEADSVGGGGSGGDTSAGGNHSGCACGSEEACVDGNCQPWQCIPGSFSCSDQELWRCSDDGLEHELEQTCDDECVELDGDTYCLDCEAGQLGCGSLPPSCQGLETNCGLGNESCCTSVPVPGGTFYRSGDAANGNISFPATVGSFRLDKFEVTVGRFRAFVDAAIDGWRPATGSGKHTHLNGGFGLVNAGGAGYEPGWNAAADGDRIHGLKSAWDESLTLGCSEASWTPNPGTNENLPINCVDWYQSYAFCIWDGGFLTSEAEWNYAAAGGGDSEGQRYFAWSSPPEDDTVTCTHANFSECGASPIDVGILPQGNGRFGHADLVGNVWEWNLDWVVDYETTCENCAALGSGVVRSRRGGSYEYAPQYLGSSNRGSDEPHIRLGGIGIRCARSPE